MVVVFLNLSCKGNQITKEPNALFERQMNVEVTSKFSSEITSRGAHVFKSHHWGLNVAVLCAQKLLLHLPAKGTSCLVLL